MQSDMLAEPWQIFVKDLNGITLTLTCSPHTRVRDLNRMIYAKNALVEDQQRLMFAGKQLERNRFLSDYGIQKGSTIYLLLRMLGGLDNDQQKNCIADVCLRSLLGESHLLAIH